MSDWSNLKEILKRSQRENIILIEELKRSIGRDNMEILRRHGILAHEKKTEYFSEEEFTV